MAQMNESHYGMKLAKESVLDFIAEQIQRQHFGLKQSGKVLCFVGGPGIGKSSFAKTIAKALHRKFETIPIGNIRRPSD
jgi:ATP-dependent Lon protease